MASALGRAAPRSYNAAHGIAYGLVQTDSSMRAQGHPSVLWGSTEPGPEPGTGSCPVDSHPLRSTPALAVWRIRLLTV